MLCHSGMCAEHGVWLCACSPNVHVRRRKRHDKLRLWPLESGAMLACYPGGGARYVRHIDNPRGTDGRKVTVLVSGRQLGRPL